MDDNETPSIPAGMVQVTEDQFFALLYADKRDIMPKLHCPFQTTWETKDRFIWGWHSPGWKNRGAAPRVYAVLASVANADANKGTPS